MRSMTFLVNDYATASGGPTPTVAVTITENSDGTLTFSLQVIGGVVGDLRGFFFDIANESLIGTLSVTPTSAGFTEFRQGDDSIKDLGGGANMQGLLGDGGYDAGVEIGSPGSTTDDYQSFSFTLGSSAGALTLEDFANVDIGVRLGSVGDDRGGDAKLLERSGQAIDAKDDAAAATEDAAASQVSGNVFGNDLNLSLVREVTALNGSAANVGQDIQGTYGSLRLELDGSYAYTLDNSRAATQALAAGQLVIESFAYTAKSFDELTSFSTDSASLVITITGSNDAPSIAAGVEAGAVAELADNAPGEGVLLHSTADTFDFSDLDLSDEHAVSVTAAGDDYLGELSAEISDAATGDGSGQVTWNFEVADGAIEHLGAGDALTQIYTLAVDDGEGGSATQEVTVTINGANDAPVIVAADAEGEVFEDGARRDRGQLVATDVDKNAALTWTVDGPTVVAVPDYHFLIDNLLIVRNGTTYFNDDFGGGGPPPQAPNLFGMATPASYLMQGSLLEANGRAIIDGSLSVQINNLGALQPFHGSAAQLVTDSTPDLSLGLKMDDSFTVESRFDLVLPEQDLQAYGVRLIDFNGSDLVDVRVRRDEDGVMRVVMREVDVPTNSTTILGSLALEPLAGDNQIVLRLTHDAAAPGAIRASFDLLGAGPTRHFDFDLDAVGRIFGTGTPGDASDDEVFTRAQITASAPSDLQNGVYGTLSVDADGEWSYALAKSAANVQALAQGEHVTDTFTVRVTDEHGASDTQTVTVDITGSNDGPVISTASTSFGSVQEDFMPTASGQIVASDVDHGALLRYTVGPALQVPPPGIPGTVTFFTYGADYHFTLDQLRIERNGDVLVDDFDAGGPPPAAGGSLDGIAATYLVPLNQFTESGGRLHLDGSLATPQRGIGNPSLTVGQLAVLATNNDPNDLTRGLKSDDDFEVEARYDLALPQAGEVYGITLTDNAGNSLPQDQLGDSNMSLLVRRDAGGNLIVQLNDFDVVTDVGVTRQALLLEPAAGENQIVLRLIHDKDQPGLIRAEFDLLGGAGGPRTFAFTEVAHAFGAATPDYAGDDEDWTRVQLVAFGPDQFNGTSLAGTYGTLSVQQNGQWTYALDPVASQALAQGQFFVENFSVRVTDEHGLSSARVVQAIVNGSNDQVIATGGVVGADVQEDGNLFTSGNVTFFDPDLIDFHSASFFFAGSSLGPNALGTFSLGPISESPNTADGSVGWTYTLDNDMAQFLGAGQTVTEFYQVSIQDPFSFGFGAHQLVAITITGADETGQGPDALPATFFTFEDVEQLNGGLSVFNPGGTPLTFSLASAPQHGVAVVLPDGTFRYTPEANYGGPDSFEFGISDGLGGEDTATITLQVQAIPDAPTISVPAPGSIVTTENVPVALNIAAALNDNDGSESLSISISGVFPGASLSAGFNIGAGIWHLTPEQLPGLLYIPVPGSDEDVTLQVQALSTESSTGVQASAFANLSIIVNEAAGTPPDGEVFEDGARTASGELDLDGAAVASVNGFGPNTLRADYRFLLDNLAITRSLGGSPLAPLGDGFNNGVPPPAGETATPTPGYFNTGTFLESNGRLIMDGSLAAPSPVPPPPSGAVLVHNAVLNTDTGADPTQGLKRAQEFRVEARFDLAQLDEALETYGVRLSDSADDVIEIDVRRVDAGTVAVVLRESDVPGAAPNVISQLNLLTAPGDNQIVLRLSHAADANFVTASFDVLNGLAITQSGSFFSAPDIFTGENWTRAQINAFGPATPQNGQYGTLKVAADGSWSYSLANNAANVQALAQDQTVRDTFTVNLSDGTSQTIEVDVSGSEDSPVVGTAAPTPFNGGYVLEDGAQQTASGLGFGFDTDTGASLHWSVSRGNAYSSNYLVRLDDLTVTKNGAAFFNDAFNDGTAPSPTLPNGGNPMAAAGFGYLPSGIFTESGDRLVINGQLAAARQGSDVDQLVAGHLLSLGSNIDPADLTRGLKIDDDFTVSARYDLTLPALDGQSYGVSLTDNVSGSLPYDQHGDDVITVEVARVDGELRVQLLDRDVAADRTTVLESMLLTPLAGEDQIVLRLTHDEANAGVVEAAFDLLAGGVFSRTVAFSQTAHIFGTDTVGTGDDENWTRVQLIATGLDQNRDATTVVGTFGTFSIDAATGEWDYFLDNGLAQSLGHGARAVDAFNVRVIDEFGQSTSRQFGISVVGTADGPTSPLPVSVTPDPANANGQIISGTDGNDLIAGGAGADLLIGHGGADTFDYNNIGDANDTIADFSSSQGDKLDLRDLLLSLPGYQPGVSDPTTLVSLFELNFTGGRPGTVVMVDQDGAPLGTAIQIALLEGATGVQYSDLILV